MWLGIFGCNPRLCKFMRTSLYFRKFICVRQFIRSVAAFSIVKICPKSQSLCFIETNNVCLIWTNIVFVLCPFSLFYVLLNVPRIGECQFNRKVWKIIEKMIKITKIKVPFENLMNESGWQNVFVINVQPQRQQ